MTLEKIHFAGRYIYLNKRSDGSVLFANGNDLNRGFADNIPISFHDA